MKSNPDDSGSELTKYGAPGVLQLFESSLAKVRDEVAGSTYLEEARRVLRVDGYRSAIGCIWNAVVDDLRRKVMHRSLDLFNKVGSFKRQIKTYEDFQDCVTDEDLIEGAYKIGVIGWEAAKLLRHAKETRHIFDGHPASSDPSFVKALAMMEDCTKYVLSQEYPNQIVDINDYLAQLGTQDFDRNEVAIESALAELPETYKNELSNRLFGGYINADASSIFRSNVEFAAPILWRVLPKSVKAQIVRRLDQEIQKGNGPTAKRALSFVRLVGGLLYLSHLAKMYVIKPMIDELESNLDKWSIEDRVVQELRPYAPYVPDELRARFVAALTHTYVGHMGGSYQFSRTDFYANGAALVIPGMFEAFDDSYAFAFVECVRSSEVLRRRLEYPAKVRRLRSLANIVLGRVSDGFKERDLLELLVDESREKDLFQSLVRK